MPGTIQVSVLEFKGIYSSDPSAISIKVSIGKRCYRTQDKGDFSFPVAKLSEELAVTLVDEEGNEIAYTGIRVMQIIQKGTWDDIFLLEGGGQVHLKLHFFLSEEEKNRIRVMRESAMKKNLETTSNINRSRSESTSLTRNNEEKFTQSKQNVSVMSREAEASPADSPLSPEASSVASTSSYLKEKEIIRENETPETETQSSKVHETIPAQKIEMPLPVLKSKDPDPKKKSPSNVKKMISAFERGQLKDVKPLQKAASVLPEQKIVIRKERSLEGQDEKRVAQSSDPSVGKAEVAHPNENLSQNLINVSGHEYLVPSDSQPFSDLKESDSTIAPLESSEITSVEPTLGSNRSPVALTSSNILNQDVEKSLERAVFTQPEQSIAGKEGSLEDKDEKGVTKLTDQSSREFADTLFTGNLDQTIPSVSGLGDLDSSHTGPSLALKDLESSAALMVLSGEESDASLLHLSRQSVSETATCSGRVYEVQSKEIVAYDSSAVEEEENETNTGLEGSKVIDVQGSSDQKSEPLDFNKEKYNSPESSGVWIFPHIVGRVCITTAGHQVMKFVELQHIEANTNQEREVSLESEILEQQHEINETDYGSMPDSGSFPDDSHNRRRFGQAIKVAVVLGFGVLVLLTRKKEPRKKRSGGVGIPNHNDETTKTE